MAIAAAVQGVALRQGDPVMQDPQTGHRSEDFPEHRQAHRAEAGADFSARHGSAGSPSGFHASFRNGSLPPWAAATVASAALVVPYALSRSTSPTPDHPGIYYWYRSLKKPSYQPPDVVIPLAWTAIESGLAVAAYRLLRQPAYSSRNRSLAWLAANVVAIGAWNRLFFGARRLPASTVAAGAMVAGSAVFVAQARRADGVAAAAGVPLTAWLAVATLLTAAIWRRNR
jgi:benzodiazapine receptor